MKVKMLLVCFLMVNTMVFAQKKSKDPITLKNGTVLKVGDELMLGSPQMSDHNDYSFIFYNKKRSQVVNNRTVINGQETVKHGLVKKIKHFLISETEVRVVLKSFPSNYYVDIEEALAAKEISYSKYLNSETSVSAVSLSNGIVLNVGDKLILQKAKQSKYNFYDFVAEDLFFSKCLDYRYTFGDSKLKRFGSEWTIKSFLISEGENPIAVLKPGFVPFYVELENAFGAEEVTTFEYQEKLAQKEAEHDKLKMEINASRNYLQDSTAFMYMLKFNGEVTRDLAKEYFCRYRKDQYNNVRDDEFLFHQAILDFKKEVESFVVDTSIIYSGGITERMDYYDFDRLGYPILTTTGGLYLVSDGYKSSKYHDLDRTGIEFHSINAYFTNNDHFNFLPLSPEEAKAFTARRKSTSGDIDRSINSYIYYKIKGLLHDEDGYHFIAEIQKIEYFEDDQMLDKLMGTVTKKQQL